MPTTRFRIEAIHPHGHGLREVRVAEPGGVMAAPPQTWLIPTAQADAMKPGDFLLHEKAPREANP